MVFELGKSCCSHLTLNAGVVVCSVDSSLTPREEDAKFFQFSKIFWVCPSRADSRSKKFPEIPMIFRVPGGNPNSRQGRVLELRIVKDGLVTWDAPEPFAVSGS